MDSTILSKDEQMRFLGLLYDNLKKQQTEIHSFDMALLFRASEHNFKGEEFHNHCNDKGSTVTIIQNEHDIVFGGYLSKSWKSGTFFPDSNAFLYTIRPDIMYIPFNDGCENDQWASFEGGGPVFGSGCDIYISGYCNEKDTCYSLPRTFQFDEEQIDPQKDYFQVIEYEVFSIKTNDSGNKIDV